MENGGKVYALHTEWRELVPLWIQMDHLRHNTSDSFYIYVDMYIFSSFLRVHCLQIFSFACALDLFLWTCEWWKSSNSSIFMGSYGMMAPALTTTTKLHRFVRQNGMNWVWAVYSNWRGWCLQHDSGVWRKWNVRSRRQKQRVTCSCKMMKHERLMIMYITFLHSAEKEIIVNLWHWHKWMFSPLFPNNSINRATHNARQAAHFLVCASINYPKTHVFGVCNNYKMKMEFILIYSCERLER